MPKYRVAMSAIVNLNITVEADSEDAAIEAAYEEMPGDLCVHCSGWDKNWSRDLGEFEVDEDIRNGDGEVIAAAVTLED